MMGNFVEVVLVGCDVAMEVEVEPSKRWGEGRYSRGGTA
jgi:hypothetical protein